jgi:hypothetical protein
MHAMRWSLAMAGRVHSKSILASSATLGTASSQFPRWSVDHARKSWMVESGVRKASNVSFFPSFRRSLRWYNPLIPSLSDVFPASVLLFQPHCYTIVTLTNNNIQYGHPQPSPFGSCRHHSFCLCFACQSSSHSSCSFGSQRYFYLSQLHWICQRIWNL